MRGGWSPGPRWVVSPSWPWSAGGGIDVYAAYDPRLDRKIALKLLNETTGREEKLRKAPKSVCSGRRSRSRVFLIPTWSSCTTGVQ